MALVTLEAALPCCVAMRPGAKVFLSNEDVIILWDKERGIEHFVRRAQFNTDQSDFGFIVPTPTKPELSEADSGAFEFLQKQIPPPREPISFSCGRGDLGPAAKAMSVKVLGIQQVGSYTAAILQATDGTALNAWLSKNGYATREAMTKWLDSYAKQKWIFTAFKFSDNPKETSVVSRDTEAIRVSFKTDRPHYPYKMPSDTWPANHNRPMRVYFVSSTPFDAKYEGSGKNWEATVTYTGRLAKDGFEKLCRSLQIEPPDMPKGQQSMTVFENGSNPDGYDVDLYFSPGSRLPLSQLPWLVVIIGFCTLWYWMIRRSRKMAGTA